MAIQFQKQEALGIYTGDVLGTSYSLKKYRVARITQPRYIAYGALWVAIWPYPVISITGVDVNWNMKDTLHSGDGYFNDIQREGDRWFTANHEIYIEKMDDQPMVQMDLFNISPEPPARPYALQQGVDYGLEGQLWQCQVCGKDFNAVKDVANPKHCGRVSYAIFAMGDPNDTRCTYQRYLGYPKPGEKE